MSTYPAPQLEEMRYEMGRLRGELARLEARLGEEAGTEDVWDVWPYTWARAVRAFLASHLEAAATRAGRLVLQRRNARALCRAKARGTAGALHLV